MCSLSLTRYKRIIEAWIDTFFFNILIKKYTQIHSWKILPFQKGIPHCDLFTGLNINFLLLGKRSDKLIYRYFSSIKIVKFIFNMTNKIYLFCFKFKVLRTFLKVFREQQESRLMLIFKHNFKQKIK